LLLATGQEAEVRDVLARLLMREDLSATQRAEAEALMARLPGASR
jgi:hypothetical protein